MLMLLLINSIVLLWVVNTMNIFILRYKCVTRFFTTLIHHFKRWINVNVRDEAHIYSLCYSRFLTQKFKVCTTFEMPNWPCHDDNREKEVVRFSSNPILFFRFWVARAIDERIEGFYMWWTFIVFFKLCVYKHTNSKNQFKTLLLIQ